MGKFVSQTSAAFLCCPPAATFRQPWGSSKMMNVGSFIGPDLFSITLSVNSRFEKFHKIIENPVSIRKWQLDSNAFFLTFLIRWLDNFLRCSVNSRHSIDDPHTSAVSLVSGVKLFSFFFSLLHLPDSSLDGVEAGASKKAKGNCYSDSTCTVPVDLLLSLIIQLGKSEDV